MDGSMHINAAPPQVTEDQSDTGPVSDRLRLAARLLLAAAGIALEAGAVLAGAACAGRVVPGTLLPAPVAAAACAYAFAAAVLAAPAAASPALPTRRIAPQWLVLSALVLSVALAGPPGLRAAGSALLWLVLAGAGIAAVRHALAFAAERHLAVLVPPRPAAFIGNSASAARMLAQLRADPRSRVRPVGYFDDRNDRPGPLTGVLPWLGSVDGIVDHIHRNELADVYMALPWSASERMSQLLGRLRFLPLTVRLVPDHVPPALPGHGEGRVEGVVMPTLMLPPFSAAGGALKRGIDLAASCVLLVPLVPLFAVVALLIRLDSPGPVFFRQPRSGQYGRSFRIFKFRTLHVAQADAAAETLVTRGDSRVTRVGRVLRKYSIDELPQILNVILNDMSLVGPRPHAPRAKANGRIYAELLPDYMLRYRVKPGMTGWAQVNGWRGNTDTEEQLRRRVEFDFDYIGRWSLRRDLAILVRTVPSMLLPPASNA